MNPATNTQTKVSEMYPGIYQATAQSDADQGPNLPIKPLNTLLGFDLETYQVPLEQLLPCKKVVDGIMSTRKYKQIVSSIHEIGLIEPLSVIQLDPKKSEFLLLDGHLRVLALKELGLDVAPCLMAKDDETFSYNHRVNRLSTVQEHYMLRRAIDRGVSRERLARAFNVNLSAINRRINLLEGICPEAIDLLQDKQFTPDVTRILRNMKAARQVEAVELMVASNTITVAHAEALLKATPPEQRTDVLAPDRDKKTSPIEQIVKLEKEMSQVQTAYKDAESHYGSDLLNLMVAKGYLTKLLANGAVKSFIERHEPEILAHFELVVNTVSMEEALHQRQPGSLLLDTEDDAVDGVAEGADTDPTADPGQN
jgi:ParB-like chromosome segregation protein Spo0J